MTWPAAFIVSLTMACNMTIFGTTAYAVFWLGHSGWWFLLAVCLCGGSSDATQSAMAKTKPTPMLPDGNGQA